ncbi:MAG: hypothetical protein LBS99_00140 [Clostridiales bacterium]|jgi:hypothetical protein|nr:hypothetical protein [Clostridiales bacterium]
MEIEDIDTELSVRKDITEGFNDWSQKFDDALPKDKKAMLLNIINRIEISEDGINIQFKVELYPLKDLIPIEVKIPETPFETLETPSESENIAFLAGAGDFGISNNTVKRSITTRRLRSSLRTKEGK